MEQKDQKPRKRRKIVPLYDRVVLQPIVEEKTGAGLLIPSEVSQKQLKKAKVVLVGPGKLNADTNQFLVTQIRPGEVVFINSYLGMRIQTDRETDYVYELDGQEFVLEHNKEFIVQKEDELICRETEA